MEPYIPQPLEHMDVPYWYRATHCAEDKDVTSERGLQVSIIACPGKGLGCLSAQLIPVLLALVHLHITPGLMWQRSWHTLCLGSRRIAARTLLLLARLLQAGCRHDCVLVFRGLSSSRQPEDMFAYDATSASSNACCGPCTITGMQIRQAAGPDAQAALLEGLLLSAASSLAPPAALRAHV